MFDNPKKELKALEGQLLAAEENQETAMLDEKEFETLYNEIRAEFTPRVEEPPIRNFANGYGTPRACAPQSAPRPEPQTAPAQKKRKQKGNGGLGFIVFLEIVTMAVVGGFWAMYLMR